MMVDLDEGREALVLERNGSAYVVSFEQVDGTRVGTHAMLDGWRAVQRVKDRLRDWPAASAN